LLVLGTVGIYMEFWAKAQLDFAWDDNGDALGATYLLGGVVDEPTLLAGGV
jgi:hypothetical protein